VDLAARRDARLQSARQTIDNAFIESLIGKCRAECLNVCMAMVVMDPAEARTEVAFILTENHPSPLDLPRV